MKVRWALVSVMVLVLLLSACGGGGGDDPAKPVKAFFDAFAAMDSGKAADTVCEQYRDTVKSGLDAAFGFFKLAGEDAKIEVTGLKLKVEDKTDNEATVVVTAGQLKFSLMGQEDVTDLAGDSEIGSVKVVKEGGKWLICDPSMAESLQQ